MSLTGRVVANVSGQIDCESFLKVREINFYGEASMGDTGLNRIVAEVVSLSLVNFIMVARKSLKVS